MGYNVLVITSTLKARNVQCLLGPLIINMGSSKKVFFGLFVCFVSVVEWDLSFQFCLKPETMLGFYTMHLEAELTLWACNLCVCISAYGKNGYALGLKLTGHNIRNLA